MVNRKRRIRLYRNLQDATTQITTQDGELIRVCINTAGAAGGTLKLLDGTDANSPQLANIPSNVSPQTFEYHIPFKNGLNYVRTVGVGMDVTVVYEVPE